MELYMALKQNIRFLYDYYRYGGLLPWLASNLCDFCMPLIYSGFIYLFLAGPEVSIYLLFMLFPLMDSVYVFLNFMRRLPGILFARKIFGDIGVPDPLIKCIQWPNISLKLMDANLLETETDFGAFNAAIDCILIDSFNASIIPNDITDIGIGILRKILHRSIRGNYHVTKGTLVQLVFEILFWPYLVVSRTFALVTKYGPEIYFNPVSLLLRDFRPSMSYRHRGYYELEFETNKRIESLTGIARDFLNEFPSPLLESLGRLVANVAGLPAIYFALTFNVKGLIIVATILLASRTAIGKTSGSYDPCHNYSVLAGKFDLDRDNVQDGLQFFMAEMPRKYYLLAFEILTILLAPIYCIHFLTICGDLQLLLGKKIITIDGSPGIFCSTRNYQHTSYSRSGDSLLNDPWLTRSAMDFEKEFGNVIRRGQDQC